MMNQGLYDALVRRFGRVTVANKGQLLSYRMLVKRSPKDKSMKASKGEYYRVNCPYCGDDRQRLWISYRWNTSEDTANGKVEFGPWLAVCYNTHCKEVYTELEDELKAYIHRGTVLPPPSPDQLAPVLSFEPTTLPGQCVPLDQLPTSHKAVQYMLSRGFDPAMLVREYAVQYCVSTPLNYKYRAMTEDRIIVPIYRYGVCVGWQSRYIGEPPSKRIPKYFTMPGYPKGSWFYSMDAAKMYRYGILVEGVTDVWRIGPPAVASLGRYVSDVQRGMMRDYWGTGALIVLLDPDVYADSKFMENLLGGSEKTPEERENPFGRFFKGTIWVKLPDNNDPADMTRDSVWQHITYAAAQKGVDLVRMV